MLRQPGCLWQRQAAEAELKMLHTVRQKMLLWWWRRRYRPGRVLTRFLAPDIRRHVEIIDTSLIQSGIISARTRTWNVLYAFKGIEPEPALGEVRRIWIKEIWNWSGAAWGGLIPELEEERD